MFCLLFCAKAGTSHQYLLGLYVPQKPVSYITLRALQHCISRLWALGPWTWNLAPSGLLATESFYLFQRIEQHQGDLKKLLLVLGDTPCSFLVFL